MSNEHFQVVVIGSGFGGSVMAYRLAEAGVRVCLLERGKRYPPNSFPRSKAEMRGAFWDPSAGLYGIYNLWSFKRAGALVASGLGGGSLIYANVLIRKDEAWFVTDDNVPWPVTRQQLDGHYDAVQRMIPLQKYPIDQPPYDQTPKTLAMRAAAEKLGLEAQLLDLAVTFGNPGSAPVPCEPIVEPRPNLHERTRTTCRLCGECDLGCNYGSKNTLDYTYLTAAKHCHADIRTLCEVRSFAPRTLEGGFSVDYVVHDPARGKATGDLSLRTITCDKLVLAAGTFGTTYLLAKNRDKFAGFNDHLGSRFSANGDLLAFIRNSRGKDRKLRILDPSTGPVITSAIRFGDQLDGASGRGCYIEDGGYSRESTWVVDGFLGFRRSLKAKYRFVKRYLAGFLGFDPDRDLSAEVASLFEPSLQSRASLPLLCMGRDNARGRMSLREKYLDLDWSRDQSREYFDGLRDNLDRLAGAMGGKYEENLPYWLLSQVYTAHPLGGCPMGRTAAEGFVDSFGQVFGCPGLYVADGSVMPGPVGPNPAFTIAALADRFATHLIDDLKGVRTWSTNARTM